MGLLSETCGAYTHNGDRDLMASLGLRPGVLRAGEWTDLGTVTLRAAEEQTYGNPEETKLCPATTVKVEVCAYPAQFWRFTITRPQDQTEHYGKDERGIDLWRAIYEPVERFVMTTGSGGFSNYWETAKAVAENMVNVERLTDQRS